MPVFQATGRMGFPLIGIEKTVNLTWKNKFKNMIWELVDLDCYLDIHLDIPSWQLDI